MATGCPLPKDWEVLERFALKLKDLQEDNAKLVLAYKNTATAKQWQKLRGELSEESMFDEDDSDY